MKTHNIKNISFDTMLSKHARNQFMLHSFSTEWRLGIMIASVFKLVTWIISVFAGYYFLFNISLPILNNKIAAIISTLIILLLIELLTWVFLSKFFKFLLKGIYIASIFSGIIAVLIYSISFHMSTNGLAARQADKINKTELIVNNNDIEKQQKTTKTADRVADYKTEIQTIKDNKNGWMNGQISRLTLSQLEDIKQYNIKIDSLDRRLKTELAVLDLKFSKDISKNKTETTKEANKYYSYVLTIMTAQLFLNFLLMFAWSRIFKENDKLKEVTQSIGIAENTIIESFFSHISDRLFSEAGIIQKSIAEHKNDKPDVNNSPFKIGFKPDDKPDDKKGYHVERGQTVTNGTDDKNRQCLYCGNEFEFKHWAKKYCSDKCRKSDWEQKNNRKLKI